MRVFLSWSGVTSLGVAEAFHRWLPSVIQEIVPYLSSRDIDKGTRWEADLDQELEAANVGVFCLTPDNLESLWMVFEAGALAKRLERARVIPFLFSLNRVDVPPAHPLSHFQSTINDQRDLLHMMETLNRAADRPLAADQLARDFNRAWPELEEALTATARDAQARADLAEPQVSERDLLEEIRNTVRVQLRELASVRSEVINLQAAQGLTGYLGRYAGWADRLRELVSDSSFKPPPHGSFEEFELLRALFLDEMQRTLGREPTLDEMRAVFEQIRRDASKD